MQSLLTELSDRLPFLRLLLMLVSGILFATYCYVSASVYLLLLVVCFLYTLLFFRKSLFGVGALLCIFMAGAFRTQSQIEQKEFPLHTTSLLVQAKLIDGPSQKTKSYRLNLELVQANSKDTIWHAPIRFVAYAPLADSVARLLPQSQLSFRCTLHPTVNSPTAYDRYLYREGYSATTYIPTYRTLYTPPEDNHRLFLYRLRNFITEKIASEERISPGTASLIQAMALGDKSKLDPDTRQAFSDAGVAHLLAVSGLHVGMLIAMLTTLYALFPENVKVFRESSSSSRWPLPGDMPC